ncbi:hypothetical protein M407DRAFT_236147 [Tulasnella calospora MUT 4182]|uniref:Uncharacterized protein n=1 Tax=Tulasnella calospora MUT 4182 TaxID=1051891 RepID=A0A0C3LX58_9AGAM|nr:hypothetical protein M407DRAFT_226977 [Tulasnella calospora MUT 4182]KIO26012.1 hypothetical protein M407DRAFT_236147 [Tulasnella calospora MUT 4182]
MSRFESFHPSSSRPPHAPRRRPEAHSDRGTRERSPPVPFIPPEVYRELGMGDVSLETEFERLATAQAWGPPAGLGLDVSGGQPPLPARERRERDTRQHERQRGSGRSTRHGPQPTPSTSSTAVPNLPPFWALTSQGPRPATPPLRASERHSKRKGHERARPQEVPIAPAAPTPARTSKYDVRSLSMGLQELSTRDPTRLGPPTPDLPDTPFRSGAIDLPKRARRAEQTRDRQPGLRDGALGSRNRSLLHPPDVPQFETSPYSATEIPRERSRRDYSSHQPSPLRNEW